MKHLAEVVSLMRAGGYFDRVMSAGPELDRVKEYLLRCAGEHGPGHGTMQRPKYPCFPGLRHRPFHEAGTCEAARILESRFETIREEATRLGEEAHLDYTRAVRDDPSPRAWTVYLFHHMGVNVESPGRRCPRTLAVLDALPRNCNDYVWGDALFSVLSGGTHLAAHCSIDNLRVRCHLGIRVPPGCELRVGGETRRWEEGRCLVFEDSFEHEAWNRSGERRIVLIADLWHPDLTDLEVRAITAGFGKSEVCRTFVRERIGMTDASADYTRHLDDALEALDGRPAIREFWGP